MFRFTHSVGVNADVQHQIEIALSECRITGRRSYPLSTPEQLQLLHGHISVADQFDVLSSVSNYHWQPYPKFGTGEISAVSSCSHVSYQQHYAFVRDGSWLRPTSVRNRFIYCTVKNMLADRHRLLTIACGQNKPMYDQFVEQGDEDEEGDGTDFRQMPPAAKLFRSCRRKSKEILGLEIAKAPVANMTLYHSSFADNFLAQVLESGVVVWRWHNDSSNTFIFNEYSVDGDIVPTQFVHTNLHNEQVQCSCNTFALINSLALSTAPDDVVSLPTDMSCMHCQLLTKHIVPLIPILCQSENNAPCTGLLYQKLLASKQYLNMGVVTLLQSPVVSKYSAMSRLDNNCCMVHISHGIVSCQSGECQARLRSRRSTKVVVDMDAAAKLCPHLEAMRAQQELWLGEMSSDDLENADELVPEPEVDDLSTNVDDRQLSVLMYI